MSITYSFIILCYNNWGLTKQTLETLIMSIHGITEGVEILILDNGSEDETGVQVESLPKKVNGIHIRYESLNRNMGYPFGINFGLSKSCGDFITVLNNDLIFVEGWFEPVIRAFIENSNIGVCVPHLCDYVDFDKHKQKQNYLEQHKQSETQKEEHYEKLQFIDRAIGACMTIKRAVLDKVGGNDLWFGAGHYDDDDWCLRIRIAGFKIAMVNSKIYHVGSATFKQSIYEQRNFVMSNREKFLRKWRMKSINDDRGKIIRDTEFSKSEHYIPLFVQDSSNKAPNYLNKAAIDIQGNELNNSRKGLLFVADWNNRDSKWKSSLLEYIKKCIHYNQDLLLWIPDKYFDSEKVLRLIPSFVLGKSNVHLIFDSISHCQLDSFIKQFDSVIKIQDDFINNIMLVYGSK